MRLGRLLKALVGSAAAVVRERVVPRTQRRRRSTCGSWLGVGCPES